MLDTLTINGLPALDHVHCIDALDLVRALPDESVNCFVSSPPYYGLRDYGVDGQIGLEDTPQQFIARMVAVFREARRVLRSDGTCWINMGDSFASSNAIQVVDNKHPNNINRTRPAMGDFKPKDLMMMPHRLAIALQDDGWYVRMDIVWHKPNPMPESVTDRPTKAHEYIFLLSKSERYWYDADAIREPSIHEGRVLDYTGDQKNNTVDPDLQRTRPNGRLITVGSYRNKRSVWTVATQPYSEAHFATFPSKLIEPCILAGCPKQVCSQCGSPYVRDVEVESHYTQRQERGQPNGKPAQVDSSGWQPPTRTDYGFKPQCQCNAGTRPGVVLDMFGGAGTTALVASQHGRQYILSELNPEYVELARRRLMTKIDRMNEDSKSATYDDLPLFSDSSGQGS